MCVRAGMGGRVHIMLGGGGGGGTGETEREREREREREQIHRDRDRQTHWYTKRDAEKIIQAERQTEGQMQTQR